MWLSQLGQTIQPSDVLFNLATQFQRGLEFSFKLFFVAKKDLIDKLALYAENRDEVIELVNELARENYQSDQRLAEMLLASQKRQGKGPNRIKMALKNKKVDSSLISEELKETDWTEQAYQLKVKKFGTEVANEPKLKAKQIRFLQYRGFDMDAIMKAIRRNEQDF